MIAFAQSQDPLVEWSWIVGHLDEIWVKIIEHSQLTSLAILFGLAISLPLGILAHRYRRLYGPLTAITGILYTIPSLALFVLLIPYTGLSTLTAEIGLVSYTLLILIRNTVAGLDSVPPETIEAATGLGFSRRQILWKVQLPLALPVIIAGVRIATVTTIGLVTVAALIGRGGLGFFILQGLRTFHTTRIVVGAVLSVALAVAADGGLLGIQKLLTPWTRARRREATG